MTQATVGEIKTVTALMASGQATGSAFHIGGYRRMNVRVPVLTSAATLCLAGEFTGAFQPFRDAAAAILSANTPGGTGGCILGSQAAMLLAAEGFPGQILISASEAQAADRSFLVDLKG